MAKAEVIVLANCTNRKRKLAQCSLRACSLPRDTYSRTSQEWHSKVQTADHSIVANQLYCGRAVTETIGVGEAIGATVAFISAGLGIVPQYQRVPAYSLTASEGHADSISERITEPYKPSLWWRALAKTQGTSHPLSRYIESSGASLVLLAAPSTYLSLVADDLTGLTPRALKIIRIFGPRRIEDVPEGLRLNWMPYDSRLDSPMTGINGTSSDFPHRALRHFAHHVLPRHSRGSGPGHAEAVQKALAQFEVYVRPRGHSASDTEVLSEIKILWKKHGGRRASMLRELRSIRQVACEQARFRRLADKVAVDLDASA